MADYNRYSVEPEDIPRRKRERRKKQAKSRSRVWLAVKLFVVVVLLALIAGLAVAAGAIYALSRDLPSLDSLQRNPLAVNTTIYDRTGKVLLAELHGGQNRVLVPSDKIPDVMKEATVAVEDARFYEHHGVDYLGVARAMLENLRAGSVVQGGSTITEQYIKNAYIGDERTYTRKIREAVLAWQLEDRWSKDQILTAYLNTVYYGAGAYGVEAAARTYFHKHAAALSLKQAAMLAALGTGGRDIDELVDGWVRRAVTYRPDPEVASVYGRLYEVYRGLYGALAPSMHELAAIGRRTERPQ